MELRREALITHALSQWLYQWIPLPQLDVERDRPDPHPLSLEQWYDYIDQRCEEPLPDWQWTQVVQSFAISRRALASLIYENLARTEEAGAQWIDFYSQDYPQILKTIDRPPQALSILGFKGHLNQPCLAIVGSRKASPFALKESHELALALAAHRWVIVSGGALGCDIHAHIGASHSLIRPCPTLIVMAGGLHKLYPRCHQYIFETLLAQGAACLSERLWNYPARPYDFPVRNRLITGLSQSLLLMQASLKSGAMVSSQLALDQGREVYILAHPEQDKRAEGSKQLLEEGGRPFFSSQDLLDLLCWEEKLMLNQRAP